MLEGMYACIYLKVNVCVYMYMHIFEYMHVYVHVHIHRHIHVPVHIHVCTCVHIRGIDIHVATSGPWIRVLKHPSDIPSMLLKPPTVAAFNRQLHNSQQPQQLG